MQMQDGCGCGSVELEAAGCSLDGREDAATDRPTDLETSQTHSDGERSQMTIIIINLPSTFHSLTARTHTSFENIENIENCESLFGQSEY